MWKSIYECLVQPIHSNEVSLTATEHIKPRVEDIVATEETPNEELSVTEEKGDVPPE